MSNERLCMVCGKPMAVNLKSKDAALPTHFVCSLKQGQKWIAEYEAKLAYWRVHGGKK